ncbi:hypothetical protein CRYUN_Cryun22dG0056600 [Craigia yunnanensis]
MVKFLKPNKAVIVLQGRYAGRKAVIVKSIDDGTRDRPYGHCLVAGIKKYPSKVIRKDSSKKTAKKSRVKCFLKLVNYQHVMSTRYTLDVDLKDVVNVDSLQSKDKKISACKATKEKLEERFKTGKNRFCPLNQCLVLCNYKSEFRANEFFLWCLASACLGGSQCYVNKVSGMRSKKNGEIVPKDPNALEDANELTIEPKCFSLEEIRLRDPFFNPIFEAGQRKVVGFEGEVRSKPNCYGKGQRMKRCSKCFIIIDAKGAKRGNISDPFVELRTNR